MKFVIVSPRQTCGGPIVLYKLAKVLQDLGYDASVFNLGPAADNKKKFYYRYAKFSTKEIIKSVLIKIRPHSNFTKRHYEGYVHIPIRGSKRKYLPWVDDDTIVVYPEIVRGNPLHAKNVVRWLLYYDRYADDDTWYSPEDLFVSYREQFFNSKLNPDNHLLKIFHFDKELYKRTNYGNRNGVCYFIRKGKDRKDLPKQYDGPILDNLSEIEKVNILNKCKICYLYDTQTFYASIAAICGCIPIVVPEPGKSKKDYVTEEDYVCGIAYGDSKDQIEEAIKTRSEVIKGIDNMLNKNKKSAIDFVKLCKTYFKLD